MAEKAKFDRSKPHVNIGTIGQTLPFQPLEYPPLN